MMLSPEAVALLNGWRFRADAPYRMNIMPFASIYWADELNVFEVVKLPESERNQIWLLFGIRSKIWNRKELSPDETVYWNEARAQLPEWALFERIELSTEDNEARLQMDKEIQLELQDFFKDADRIVVEDDGSGITKFTTTFNSAKGGGSEGNPKVATKRVASLGYERWAGMLGSVLFTVLFAISLNASEFRVWESGFFLILGATFAYCWWRARPKT
jgi:hypothetical protein